MQRREFLAASAAVAFGAMASNLKGAPSEAPAHRQLFELRTYHFSSAEKQMAFEQFLQHAAVPAFNRAGIEPVGVFKMLAKDNPGMKLEADPMQLWVLLPHNSFESVATLEAPLAEDHAFQTAGATVLRDTRQNMAFTRFESDLLLAMEGAPHVEVPTKSESRVFELRTYESRNEERARNKLEMFNGGEFAIFKKAGMPGIFYGGAIIGQNLPQLTYMVVHENMDDSKKNWQAFFGHPDWKKLSSNTGYKDNVSKVIDQFLRPAGGSQI